MAQAEPDSPPLSLGLFQREQRSLFGEILDWMLTPLLLLWPLSLALTWFVAQNIAAKPFDRALSFNLQTLSQSVVTQGGQVRFELTPQARDLLRADDTDLIYYQLIDPRKGLIAGEDDLPMPGDNSTPEPGKVLLRDDVVRGDAVRVAYVWLTRTGSERLVLMQMAETKGKRSTLAAEIIKGVMVPQFIILPLAVLLVWLALVRGIRPLSDLEQRIRARRELWERKEAKVRAILAGYLDGHERKQLKGRVRTISLRPGSTSVEVFDESRIPAQYKTVVQTTKVDKRAIRETFDSFIDVPGAALVEGAPTVTVK